MSKSRAEVPCPTKSLCAKTGHLPLGRTGLPRKVEQTNRDGWIDFSVGRGAGTMNFRVNAGADRRQAKFTGSQ